MERDESSGRRRYREDDVDTLQALACLRAMGVGIDDMRTYQANRTRGHEAAGEQRDLLLRHAERIGYSPKPGAEYTEADWTDPDTPGLPPYPRSKTIAERTARDFIEHECGDTELVVVNPTFILGPTLWRRRVRRCS